MGIKGQSPPPSETTITYSANDAAYQPTKPPLRGGWTRPPVGQMASPQPEWDLRDHTSSHSSPHTTSLFSSQLFTSVAPYWCSATLLLLTPCPPWAPSSNLSSAPSSSVTLFFHSKKERPLRLSMSLLLHFFSLLIQTGIEPHQCPIQDPCSVCGDRVNSSWVAFLFMVCDQWCHRSCSGIHSPADYRRLAPWSCPTCSTPVPPAAPIREPESSDLERTRSTLSSEDSLSQRFLSIGPSSTAQTSTAAAAPGPTLEKGRLL